MKIVVSFALPLLLVLACAGSDRSQPSQFYTDKPAGYSVGQPDGWSTSDDHGATRFSSPRGKQTIVVRSTPRPAEIVEGKPTENADIVEATRRVIQRMARREKVADPIRVRDSELPGARFSFSYRPQNARTAYRREHVVLFGERHIYHVFQTAPLDEAFDAQAMQMMVSTLSEEG